MRPPIVRLAVIASLLAILGGCDSKAPAPQPESTQPSGPAEPSAPQIAEHMTDDGYQPIDRFGAVTTPDDNPMTQAKVDLGWWLYFDTRLSGDGKRSCYGCHVNEKGLTDGQPLAVGAFEKKLTRHSPTMWNVGLHQNWYWDGRASTLEAQAAAAWKGANMGAAERVGEIVASFNAIPAYVERFQKAFGEDATADNIPKALASYMRTIVSYDTAFDRWQKGDEAAVSDAAKRGYEAFKKFDCAQCHAGVLFTDLQFHNVGIGMGAEKPDLGRFAVTKQEQDKGAFKTPTLRDVVRSAPYFHDGSVATLEEAVKIMLAGGIANPWLATKILKPREATAGEFKDLLEFLGTLEEPTRLVHPKLP